MATCTGTRPIILVALAGLLGFGWPVDVLAQAANPTLDAYLASVGIDAQQRAIAASGRAISKLLPAADNRDVTVFGMIGLHVPRDTAVARTLDIERFLAAYGGRFHVFGTPPSAADVRDLATDESEYRGLRDCRPTDCDFKLSAKGMQDFGARVDWSASDAKVQADSIIKAEMLRLVTDYASRGNAAMPTYDDAAHSVNSGDSFNALLTQSSDLYEFAPELRRYLTTYPAEPLDGARDFLYWAEVRLPRLRPTLTLNHVVVYTPTSRPASTAFVARKQIYASHYFESVFELVAMVDAGGASGEPDVYILSVRRYRFDYLPAGLFNIRGRVRKRLVDAAQADLDRERAALERGPRP